MGKPNVVQGSGKKLALAKETLRRLSDDQLNTVGGATGPRCLCDSMGPNGCATPLCHTKDKVVLE